MTERLALAVIPGVGWSAREIQMIAREAEDAGFDAIFTAEVNNDAMATAQLMGAATRRILVGTWIANIYLRHSYACAQGAALIADATDGRFILGLGVSHQPVNGALEIDMTNPLTALRRYVTEVRSWLKGEGPTTHLPQRPAAHDVPLYVATLASPTVKLAGELADGRCLFCGRPRASRRVRPGPPAVAPGRAVSLSWISHSACPPSSETIWMYYAMPHARTSCYTLHSPFSSGWPVRAASKMRLP
ncbi:MAG TPA: LLM class flavin-dependent oxidoreductase [Blastocatellia bacterium]|nr:LLM class flavin-dependent oxidoreductase [Blastocatellia bacterium]